MEPVVYIEKGIGLHKAISNAGYSITCIDGVWLSDNPEVVQGIIDTYEDPPKTQEQINKEAQDFLDSTDWYIIRLTETGVAVPDEILTQRQVAREAIV